MSTSSNPAETIRAHLADSDVEFEESAAGVFSFALPGEKKLQTAVRLDVGTHALGVHAFVCRQPDENHERVYRWLLERNLKMYAVSFAVDHHGDIYL
ncbi:MAG: YbjN domain-containing protein, partial [Nocardioides sp.]